MGAALEDQLQASALRIEASVAQLGLRMESIVEAAGVRMPLSGQASPAPDPFRVAPAEPRACERQGQVEDGKDLLGQLAVGAFVQVRTAPGEHAELNGQRACVLAYDAVAQRYEVSVD